MKLIVIPLFFLGFFLQSCAEHSPTSFQSKGFIEWGKIIVPLEKDKPAGATKKVKLPYASKSNIKGMVYSPYEPRTKYNVGDLPRGTELVDTSIPTKHHFLVP